MFASHQKRPTLYIDVCFTCWNCTFYWALKICTSYKWVESRTISQLNLKKNQICLLNHVFESITLSDQRPFLFFLWIKKICFMVLHCLATENTIKNHLSKKFLFTFGLKKAQSEDLPNHNSSNRLFTEFMICQIIYNLQLLQNFLFEIYWEIKTNLLCKQH